ncbi:hypothetical protein IJI69_03405, partial [Candidatus Saccharibacteria bacterium]|nr:hypothetical protein [Candidatus Saccharibacteria bacterium]
PISLTRGTWGYAIPSSGVAHLVTPNGFSSTYEEMSSTTPDTSKLFAVPPTSSSNPQMIASSTSSTSGDNYPIYYAVRANSNTAPGEYSNKVLFTAVADAGTSETITLTPSSVNINTATTVTVKTSLYSTAGYANANIYFLTTAEKNSISGTNVEALGKTPLTCTKTSNTPVTYSCSLPAQTTSGTYYFYAKFPYYDTVYSSTFAVNNPVTLTVNPNGGTWNGSTSSQTFTQNEGTTKTIADPTATPTYTITYNGNSQGAAYTGSPTSVARSFTGWTKGGSGTWNSSSKVFTFGSADGTLTANYNGTSNTFTLPVITKANNTCKWAKDSASGTKYNSGATNVTITSNTTFYAVCTANDIFGISTMQEMTTAICNNTTTPVSGATGTDTTGAYRGNTNYVPTTTLTDSRGGTTRTYQVKKLADGKCWMTENLRLIGSFTPTSSDSDVASGSTFVLTASNSGTWCTTQTQACYDQSMVLDSGRDDYGAYYNWYAATAGTGTYSVSSGNASGSICPKGWRLPTGGSGGEYQVLYTKYNSSALMLGTPNFTLSGYRYGSSTNVQG